MDMKYCAAISPQLISSPIIPETCEAIYKSLKKFIKMPLNERKWKNVANEFEQKWKFNHYLGASDGKYVALTKPPHSGSVYYNYQGFFSVILFAIVNSKYD